MATRASDPFHQALHFDIIVNYSDTRVRLSNRAAGDASFVKASLPVPGVLNAWAPFVASLQRVETA